MAAGWGVRLQVEGSSVGTWRQEFLARLAPPRVPPQSPGFSGPPAYVWWWLRAPLTGWGEAMSSIAAERTETMRDLTSVVGSLWLCMLLPCGLRASVSKELTDFPFVS